MRARDLGIVIGTLEPGEHDAITDVPGVHVGHTTVIEGDDVRTGVTVVVPHNGNVWSDPVYAAYHRLNGNGEMTGLPWLEEVGLLHSPVAITNTHSVGVVRDALVELEVEELPDGVEAWALPVVAETWDGILNDVNGFHVTAEHAKAAYRAAAGGPVEEGSVGGGTGMVCHDFKGGIGTASRRAGQGNDRTRSACSCRPTTAAASGSASTVCPSAWRSARTWCPAPTPHCRRAAGRSSASSRPTLPCCRCSAGGWPSGRRSASREPAGSARTPAATSSSRSPPATAASRGSTSPTHRRWPTSARSRTPR